MALRNRAMAALGKGLTMGLFGIWVLASSVWKVFAGAPPEAVTMGVVGFAALAANALCFALLSRYRVGRQQYAIGLAVLAQRSDRQLRGAGSGDWCCPDRRRLAGCARRRHHGSSCSPRGHRCRHAGSRRDCRSGRMRHEASVASAGSHRGGGLRTRTASDHPGRSHGGVGAGPSAEVTVNGKSVRTGQDGTATTVAPPGDVRISVTKDGYFPANASLLADAARESVVRVELEPRKAVEEEIKVYATRNDVRIQDSPLHVEVLQRDEIEEKMLMTPGDIVMMLNEMGGMRVQTTSPSLGAASVRVQGMRGRYTSFLSDGLPLFGQQGAGLGLLQIPPMDLGQVEVIKGNASALYGSAAMAGVVNLISRRPAAEPVHEFLVNRSTLGATDASMFLASPLSSHWSASLLGGGDWQEHRDVDGDGWADLAGYSRGVVRPRFFWDDKNGRTALLTGGITYENRSGGTLSGAALPATGQPYTEALNTRRYDFGGNVQWLIANRYVVTARFSATEQQHRHQFGEVIERRPARTCCSARFRSRAAAAGTPGSPARRRSAMPTARRTFRVSPTPMSCRACSCRTISASPRG